MFITALFPIAKTQRQRKRPSTDERIRRVRRWAHKYNGILLSHKKHEIVSSATTWMQLESIIRSEVGQKEEDTYCMMPLMCVCVTQSCPTLGDPMDCRLPGSSIQGFLQARILGLVAIPCSRGSSRAWN